MMIDNTASTSVDISEFDIIDSVEGITERKEKQNTKPKLTWTEYLQKKYNVSAIIVLSIVVYVYYIRRKGF